MRLDLAFLAVFSAAWLLVFVTGIGWVSLTGTLHLGLYPLYSIAAALGWVAGNVFVFRARAGLEPRLRRRLLFNYYIGPPSLLFLIRALAPVAIQQAAPLVPIYSFGVYSLFFLIPVTLRSTRVPRKKIGDR